MLRTCALVGGSGPRYGCLCRTSSLKEARTEEPTPPVHGLALYRQTDLTPRDRNLGRAACGEAGRGAQGDTADEAEGLEMR